VPGPSSLFLQAVAIREAEAGPDFVGPLVGVLWVAGLRVVAQPPWPAGPEPRAPPAVEQPRRFAGKEGTASAHPQNAVQSTGHFGNWDS